MEKDNEVTNQEGTSYDFGARFYNPRVGRWLSMDPVLKPYEAPYVGMENSPVILMDPDGKDVIVTIEAGATRPNGIYAGATGHTRIFVSEYREVALQVEENGKSITKTYYVKTGRLIMAENLPREKTQAKFAKPGSEVTNEHTLKKNYPLGNYYLDKDKGISGSEFDKNLNKDNRDFSTENTYYTPEEVDAELKVLEEGERILKENKVYGYKVDFSTGEVDQKNCVSLVSRLLVAGGLANEGIGLQKVNFEGTDFMFYSVDQLGKDLEKLMQVDKNIEYVIGKGEHFRLDTDNSDLLIKNELSKKKAQSRP